MNDRTFKPATAQVGRRNVIMSGVALSAAALVPGTTLGAGTSTSPSVARKVWLITGAGRGLGLDIAKAALDAGHYVVATGRDPLKVAAAIGEHENLLSIKLDVTRPEDSQAAIAAAVRKFGRIDVLVNNAGNFYAGFFEELSS